MISRRHDNSSLSGKGVSARSDLAEERRLAALRRYRVLDTPTEPEFDDISRVAAEVCATPIALITLLDETRQWFKSRVGVDIRETPRDIAFCDHTIRTTQPMEVIDALDDARFRGNPLVTGSPDIRFYAGVPLTTPDGHNLGALCVIDRVPRSLEASQRTALQALARQVVLQLELRRSLEDANHARALLAAEVEERKRLQQTQIQTMRVLRGLIDSLQNHVAIVDGGGTITEVNATWWAFANNNAPPGTSSSLGPGANYLDICERAEKTGSREGATVGAALRRALAGRLEPGFSLEYPCHSPTENRWFCVRISAYTIDSERFAVVSHENVTQRRLTEFEVRRLNQTLEIRVRSRTAELVRAYESLHASEALFRSIFENAAMGVAITSVDGRLEKVNQALCAMAGRRRNDLEGEPLRAVIYEEDLGEIEDMRKQALEARIPGFVRDTRLVRPNGEIVWAHVSVTAIQDADGRTLRTMGLIQNVTPGKRAEDERDRFFEQSVDMFVIAGFDGRVYRANPACSRILGYPRDELRGIRYLELIHPDDRAGARETLKAIAGGNAAGLNYFDARIRTRDGRYREIRWSGAPWTDKGRIFVVGRDITRFRANERALHALAARLQGIREEERTRISREIHDELGQMLTALKMDLSLLQRDVRSGSASPSTVSEDLKAMAGLVDGTLGSVRRIAQELRPEVLDALGLIPAIQWQAREIETRAGIRCEVRAHSKLPALDDVQTTQLFRIVQEALTNVIRHADASHVGIAIDLQADKLTLTVQDDGRGFHVTAGADPSLGLLGMRERANTIGADFRIDSKPGAGTTVFLSLSPPQTGRERL